MIDTETALEARDNLTWIAARWPALHSHLAPTTGNTARTHHRQHSPHHRIADNSRDAGLIHAHLAIAYALLAQEQQ